MKITSIKLENFRGYRNSGEIKFGNLTVFVGKNDSGKSTILEALDIFFNDGDGCIKFDKDDINKDALNNNVEEASITVCFSDLPSEIIIDEEHPTDLFSEYMVNENKDLEIIKKYSTTGKPKVFIKAWHPTNPVCKELLTKKNADLKKIAKDHSIPCDDMRTNSELRKAIWDNFKDDLDCRTTVIEASKEDAKKIWEKICSYLPLYSLFRVDRENSDKDEEIQDPLKVAVKQILSDSSISNKLDEIAKEVVEKLQSVSKRTLEKLKDFDEAIADSLNPIIPPSKDLKWSDVFKTVSISGDNEIPINKRGSGIKRLILISFFRAEVERKIQEMGKNNGVIYAIEEPETSQHTYNQKILIDSLKELSKEGNVQIVLTTHSAYIVKQLEYSNLRLVFDDNGGRNIKEIEKNLLCYPSLNEVNYLAFDEISEEYHDELYSDIEEKKKFCDYEKRHTKQSYIKEKKNGGAETVQVTLSEYIRHQIHHPENKRNTEYTQEELRKSIEMMRQFISNKYQ